MTWFLVKPSVRKNQDRLNNVFHQLNLKDAVSYVDKVSEFCGSEVCVGSQINRKSFVSGRAQRLAGVHPQRGRLHRLQEEV